MKKLAFLSIVVLLFTTIQAQVVDIATARGMSLGSTVTISGIATNGGELGTIRYIQDATGGIPVYDSDLSGVQRGDQVEVTGELTDYFGLLEIENVGSGDLTIVSTGNPVPTSNVQTVAAGFSENFEGQLMQFNTVQFLDQGNFAGQSNYNFVSETAGIQQKVPVGFGEPAEVKVPLEIPWFQIIEMLSLF